MEGDAVRDVIDVAGEAAARIAVHQVRARAVTARAVGALVNVFCQSQRNNVVGTQVRVRTQQNTFISNDA